MQTPAGHVVSRRAAMRSMAAFVGSQLPLGMTMAASESTIAFPSIIDVSYETTRMLNVLKSRGVKGVFRYYALQQQPEVPTKILHRAELDALLAAGFSVGIVYQYYNNVLANLNEQRARQDAQDRKSVV